MKIGDKVRAIGDFPVEPFFDEGWEVKKGMIGFIHSLDQEAGKSPSTSMRHLVVVWKKGTSYYSFRPMRLSRFEVFHSERNSNEFCLDLTLTKGRPREAV
jgi:hypothetical protein